MPKKSLKRRIESLAMRIQEHEEKIENELKVTNPDEGKIHHWRAEINAFRESLVRAQRRLP